MKKLTLVTLFAGLGLAVVGVVFLLRSEPVIPIEPEPRMGADGCPAGELTGGLGPEMVRLPEGFCIDKTEVTRAQYKAALDRNPSGLEPSSSCKDNSSFTPSCEWPPSGKQGNFPVVCVDWCDAEAFCRAAGKRLCGKRGDGKAYPFESYDDPAVSEWFAACSSNGRYAYTYGDEFDTDRCRDADADDHTQWGLAEVGSFPDCHSPEAAYADVLDLSGHVAEWDNSCKGDGPEAPCRIRGGSFQHHSRGQRCDMGRELEWPRNRRVEAVGFRCCAD
jgi:formylglycine-generating enzyme required for sulfatase activity